MIGDTVAEVEDNAATSRGHDFRQQDAPVIKDAIHPRRVNVCDDIAALEQRKNGAQRRMILADMDHDRQIERRRGLRCARC